MAEALVLYNSRVADALVLAEDVVGIFEVADALRAPLYLHPQTPQEGVFEAYYKGFGPEMDSLFGRAGIGWHFETGMQIVRLVLAGVFDRFPNLQIITGHWGEVILFYLDRIDTLSAPARLPRKISEYVQQHVSVTPSGFSANATCGGQLKFWVRIASCLRRIIHLRTLLPMEPEAL